MQVMFYAGSILEWSSEHPMVNLRANLVLLKPFGRSVALDLHTKSLMFSSFVMICGCRICGCRRYVVCDAL